MVLYDDFLERYVIRAQHDGFIIRHEVTLDDEENEVGCFFEQ